ncbi:MAG: hypothetical protein CK532_03290 [Flavobacteriales bacterium]|nr:MAG: hypothetical protein CK532_03290 [Flavobacteriales bacterium]
MIEFGIKKIVQYKKTLGVLLGIAVLCLLPVPDLKTIPKIPWLGILGIDKWAHFVLYFFLYRIWSLENTNPLKNTWKVVLLSISFGASIEFLQDLYVRNRAAEWADFFADFSGLLFGYFVFQHRRYWSDNS